MAYSLRIALLFAILSMTSCTNLSTQTDYYAGHMRLDINTELFGTFPAGVWYPTNEQSQEVQFGVFKLNVSLAADIASGQFPLVMISHGSGGSWLGH